MYPETACYVANCILRYVTCLPTVVNLFKTVQSGLTITAIVNVYLEETPEEILGNDIFVGAFFPVLS